MNWPFMTPLDRDPLYHVPSAPCSTLPLRVAAKYVTIHSASPRLQLLEGMIQLDSRALLVGDIRDIALNALMYMSSSSELCVVCIIRP